MIRSIFFLLFAALAGAADDYGTSTAAPVIPPPQPGPPYLQLAPMLGHVSANAAHIWVKATGAVKASVRISEQADLSGARMVNGPALTEETAFAGTIEVSELAPATRYFYRVDLDGDAALARPWPSFVTAPADGTHGKLRFMFGSCVGKEPWLDAAVWADLDARATQNPATPVDLVLLLGDNHYANTTDPAKQRAAFIAHRTNAGFRALFVHTPLYSIWDDHDYGRNDSDSTEPGKDDALRTFKQFFANPGYGEPDNNGVYYRFTRGDVDFFMLDDRYYRTPNKTPDGPEKTMLGPKQLAWLKRELLASKGTIKVLGIGGEWQAHGTDDSWKSFLRERDDLFAFLAANEIKNVLLLSGDRHFTAGYQVEGRFIEITSGPLGSPNANAQATPETFALHGHGKMYCIYDLDTAATPPAVAIEFYEAGVGLLEKRVFTWDEVIGAAKIKPNLPPAKTPAKP